MVQVKHQMIVVYLIMIVIFSLIYYNINTDHMYYASNCNPDSYIDHLYFSTTVSSTVGFGDILPRSPLAKTIVMIHELCIIAVAVALII